MCITDCWTENSNVAKECSYVVKLKWALFKLSKVHGLKSMVQMCLGCVLIIGVGRGGGSVGSKGQRGLIIHSCVLFVTWIQQIRISSTVPFKSFYSGCIAIQTKVLISVRDRYGALLLVDTSSSPLSHQQLHLTGYEQIHQSLTEEEEGCCAFLCVL